MAKTNDFTFEVIKKIGSLGEDSKKQLNIISWNGKEPKLDIREFYEKDGEEKCGKGIALTNDEAKELVNLLNAYFEEDEDDDF